MVREDLINGAVSFLQDPTVASAPLEQRIAFLQSKNLTQEEIDLSLQRAGSESPPSSSQPPQQQNYSYQQQPQYRQPPPYNGYQNGNYWQQPPPEVPRRDWRDWFIMATVVGGVGYGAYFIAKRYIYPIIAPPTPPQLEQDKAAIDTSFEKAFALLDQLATDTDKLKSAEKDRTERLDLALSEVEAVIGQMKEANRRRDDDSRRVSDEVRSLRDLIPKAIKAQEESSDMRLKELGGEMRSLKTLLNNRVGGPSQQQQQQQLPRSSASAYSLPQTQAPAQQNGTSSTESTNQPSAETASKQADSVPGQQESEAKLVTQTPDRSSTSSPYGRMMNGRAAIPAWQMAAAKKNAESNKSDSATANANAESGTAVDGASG